MFVVEQFACSEDSKGEKVVVIPQMIKIEIGKKWKKYIDKKHKKSGKRLV